MIDVILLAVIRPTYFRYHTLHEIYLIPLESHFYKSALMTPTAFQVHNSTNIHLPDQLT